MSTMTSMFRVTMVIVHLLVAAATSSASLIIAISASSLESSSSPVDPRFLGFAFEEASFVEYAHGLHGKPNVFSQNLINAISARTGSAPIIRVGGTSADYALYNASQSTPALPVAQQNNVQNIGNTTIGPSFWKLFKAFPNASFIFQVPLGINNVSRAVAFALAGIDVIGLKNIEAIELGNEPDLYPSTNAGGVLLTPPIYQGAVTNESYVYTFGAFASAISSALNLPAQNPIFQAFDTSHHFDVSESYELDVASVFEAGLNLNNTIKAVSHHYYQSNTTGTDLQTSLMNHQAIVSELDYFKPFIAYCRSVTTGTHSSAIPFVLGEVGNSLNAGNNYTFQAVLGSALWQVDFQLYALAIGVSRIYWQQIMHAGYNLWLPVQSAGLPAQVFANFYAQPFIADFISTGNVTRVSLLNITSAPDYIAAYAAFEDDQVKRVAIVNLNLWDKRSANTRPTTNLTLTGLGDAQFAEVRLLNSPDGAYANASSITYAGSQWTATSKGEEVLGVNPSGNITYTVDNGQVTLVLQDSSAALVILS